MSSGQKHNNDRQRSGQVLILCYLIIMVFIVFLAGLSFKAVNEKNIAQRTRLENEAFYLAEGGVEDAIASFARAIADYQISPAEAGFNVSTNFTTFSGAKVDSTIVRLEDEDRTIEESGTNIFVRNYMINATAVHPNNSGIRVVIHQIIARRLIPTFQHAVFYNDDLEVLPGRDMDLNGRIHSNKDIYLDADGSDTDLTVNSTYLHSAGDIYNQRKDTGSPLSGEVSIRVTKPGAPQFEDMDNLDSDDMNWTSASTDRWKGTVQSAVHGVTALTAPSVASIQPEGYYASHANITINNGVIKRDGVALSESATPLPNTYPPGTINTTQTFYNNREGKTVGATKIDLARLAGYVNGTQTHDNNLPANGLLYVTSNNTGSNQPGIELVNGTRIERAGGLTVVSDDPVYIQGDYNTDSEKPAAVICDSLNILSNNWRDTNSTMGFSSRSATATTVNCAFIAGINGTTSGNYNGGLENYPRLHEDWYNVALNIEGSFIALWNSTVATGPWKIGTVGGVDYYKAPRRYWTYNTDFNDPGKLPPFTPWAVEARRIVWWKE